MSLMVVRSSLRLHSVWSHDGSQRLLIPNKLNYLKPAGLLVLVRWPDCWKFPFSAQAPASVTEPHLSPKVWHQMANTKIYMYIWRKTSGSLAHTETWWCFTPSPANHKADLLPAPLPPPTGSQPTRHLSLTLHHLSIRSDLDLTAGRLCTGMSVQIHLNPLVFF